MKSCDVYKKMIGRKSEYSALGPVDPSALRQKLLKRNTEKTQITLLRELIFFILFYSTPITNRVRIEYWCVVRARTHTFICFWACREWKTLSGRTELLMGLVQYQIKNTSTSRERSRLTAWVRSLSHTTRLVGGTVWVRDCRRQREWEKWRKSRRSKGNEEKGWMTIANNRFVLFL